MTIKQLTATEKKVAVWILRRRGKTQIEIAEILDCNVRTVKRYWHLSLTVSKERLADQVKVFGHF